MRFPYVVFLSACALMWTATLLAQSPNGVINGLVVDPSNKVIAGADILVINDVTGVKHFGKTNSDGIYVLPNLPPGAYRLQVSKVGFKTLIKPDIVLNIQDALSINFTLPLGAVFETVTVEGGASMINTTDASVSTVIDQTYVENMPLNGRSFQDLILLTPGVTTQSSEGNGSYGLGQTGEFSVNGQRPESNYYTVDGVSANTGVTVGLAMNGGPSASGSVATATALGTTQALVSVDDLQEFRVQSSTYSAEYGRNPGGQFAFETKSGTNQWHGTAYDYLRNGALDAQDWFNDYFGTPEPALRQNDFGGTIGGPAEVPGLYRGKDRTFGFFSYEGLRLVSPQAATASFVPDLCIRDKGSCPSGRNPAASAVLPALNAFPVPSPNGIDDTVNGIAQYIGSWSNPSSLDSTSARIDHVVNDRLRLFFRFSDTTSSAVTRGTTASNSTPTVETTSDYILRTYTAGATSVFTSRLSNEFRLNYASNRATKNQIIDDFGGGIPADLVQLSGLNVGSSASLALAYSGYILDLAQDQQIGSQKQWNLVDRVNLSLGRHVLKFGLDYRRLAPFDVPYTPLVFYYYISESAGQTNSPYVNTQAYSPAYPLYTNFSAFAQDEWKVSQRVSLSLGLRWEVNPAPGATRGLKPYTIQGASPDTWTLAPQGTPLWQTTWFNFAPRLGVAYTLHDAPGWETVMRAGGGVFFDTGQQLGSLGFSGVGFAAQTGYLTGSFPSIVVVPTIVNPPVSPYSSVIGFAPHLQLPYTLQWNASIEQALGKSQALTLSYVGAHGARLLEESDILTQNNQNIGFLQFVNNGLSSDYDSLQVQFRRRLSRGFTTLASYTWSHCMDYGSQNYLLGYERGNCDFDVRHNLSAAFSYDLPNVGNKGFVNAMLHRWGLDDRLTARSSFPVTLGGNATFDPTTGELYNVGLNLVPGQPIYLYGANCAAVDNSGVECPGGRAINPNAFTSPSAGLGDAPRNSVRGFGALQMDLAVRRNFPIHERVKLQFRAEAFNIFNRPNFGMINPNLGTSTFGQTTATLANSLGVLSPLYQMGGPRSMQFALKVLF
jgi:hypothetical protein